MTFTSIPPADFEKRMKTGAYQLIDVRTPEEISQRKIAEDALEIDFHAEDFQARLQKLPKEKKYLLYCRSGKRSIIALSIMKDLGFSEVYELQGGINDWHFFTSQ